MTNWSKFLIFFGACGCLLVSTRAAGTSPSASTEAIQAIQQASDPSAVVAAYANGTAVSRNDPKIYEAYVNRMVDLGLPEVAYHQAQALTTLQSNSGLAWGVVAYVAARRGEMSDAISAINLAGQYAPDNKFIQRTAGEIVAWYDTKADKSKLPDNAKDGLTKVRAGLEKLPVFTEAYNTAKNAYQGQASAPQAPAQAAPSQYQYQAPPQAQTQVDQVAPLGYAAAAPLTPAYYPPYYYDWGPTWVAPAPWWWWQPVGFFAGFDFFPFSTVIVFDHDHFFHHHHFFANDGFFHDHGFFHDRSFHHDGLNVAFHDSNHAFFQRDGRSTFFGTTARPNASLAMSRFGTGMSQTARMMPSLGGTFAGQAFRPPNFIARTAPGVMPMSRGFAAGGFRGGGFNSGGFHGGGFHGGGRR